MGVASSGIILQLSIRRLRDERACVLPQTFFPSCSGYLDEHKALCFNIVDYKDLLHCASELHGNETYLADWLLEATSQGCFQPSPRRSLLVARLDEHPLTTWALWPLISYSSPVFLSSPP